MTRAQAGTRGARAERPSAGRRPALTTHRWSRWARRCCARRAREAGLAYELLAARADLQAIVAASREAPPEADVRTLRGWRRELAGAELLELLDGRLSLSVSGSGRARRVKVERGD